MEWLRRRGADDPVDFASERLAGLRRGDRHGDDDLPRMLPAKRFDGRTHGRARGQPVVDEHDRTTFDLWRWASAAIRPLAFVQLLDRPLERPVKFSGTRSRSPGLTSTMPPEATAPMAAPRCPGSRSCAPQKRRAGHRAAAQPAPLRARLRAAMRGPGGREFPEIFEPVGQLLARVAPVAIESHGRKIGPAAWENNRHRCWQA